MAIVKIINNNQLDISEIIQNTFTTSEVEAEWGIPRQLRNLIKKVDLLEKQKEVG